MKFDIPKELMSQSSYFKSRPDLFTLGELEGKPEIFENAYKCRRYIIDITGLDLLSSGELGVGICALASLVLLDVLER